MKLKVKFIDKRSQYCGSEAVEDEETGNVVGAVYYTTPPQGRHITLFNKYSGQFDKHEECVAFAKGVEAVLNHMVAYDPPKRP